MAFLIRLHKRFHFIFFFILFLFTFTLPTFANSDTKTQLPQQCTKSVGTCHNKSESLKLKVIAIASILVASMIGVCLPLFCRKVTALQPDKDLFVVVKAFASGVILATGYMHVLPDSFDCLKSECLPENPWRKFPFTTFVAMLSALVTLMLDSFSMSYHRKHDNRQDKGNESNVLENGEDSCDLKNNEETIDDRAKSQVLVRYRVVAQVYINILNFHCLYHL